MTLLSPHRVLCALLLVPSLGVGCGGTPEEATDTTVATSESARGDRYCEVLLASLEEESIEAQVWGTQGLNDCPEAAWASVDAGAIAAEFEVTAAVLNGPRYWVLDAFSGEVPEGSPRLFGTLEMRQLAALTLERTTSGDVSVRARYCQPSGRVRRAPSPGRSRSDRLVSTICA